MKKVILFLLFGMVSMAMMSFIPMSSHPLDLSVGIIKIKPGGTVMPRTPIYPPVIGMEERSLYFETDHPVFTLVLIDEDGEVTYQVNVPSVISEIDIPNSLTGEYELQLYDGSNFYYYCGITL